MRRDWLVVAAIAVGAFAIRVYPAWNGVFAARGSVNFLETDAWYHVRLVENQVHNFPWRVTRDPYAAPGGQFVPIAPLYDTITAAAVVALYGRDASTESIERIAAFIPPVLGTVAVMTVWRLGRRLFGRLAGLFAAGLLAILPGHFLDRTMLGFVDHHALEALLALATLLAIASDRPPSPAATTVPGEEAASSSQIPQSRAGERRKGTNGGRFFRQRRRSLPGTEVIVGISLGLYLLAWGSGAFLVAILAAWLAALVVVTRDASDLRAAARLMVGASIVALALVFAFQDPAMHRYGTQVVSLAGLAALALVIGLVAGRELTRSRKVAIVSALAAVSIVAALATWSLNPVLMRQVVTDLGRLTPDPERMGVLEARPLFLYPGEWNWLQPWQFFRAGFYVGLAGLVALAVVVWRRRRPLDLLVWIFGLATFAATIGQNRFGYYLVPACALLGGWLAASIVEWARVADASPVPHRAHISRLREVACASALAAIFAPNLAPAVLFAPRTGSRAAYWEDTMQWLRHQTTPPFANAAAAGDEYYLARYPRDITTRPDYAVMSWWDQGYWLIQRARRVPVANPTQERASIAARFYAETDEARARELLAADQVRFVLSDWELPFRLTRDGTMMGRFQNVLDWAGATHGKYYEIVYRRVRGTWTPLWVFHEDYYRSMAYRLTVLGGLSSTASHSTTVMTVADRTDASGMRFREVVGETTFETYQAALERAATTGAAETMVVGVDPWRTAFPIDGMKAFVQVHAARTPEQAPTEGPWVRVFEVR